MSATSNIPLQEPFSKALVVQVEECYPNINIPRATTEML